MAGEWARRIARRTSVHYLIIQKFMARARHIPRAVIARAPPFIFKAVR